MFVYQPTGVGSDYRSSCARQEKGADEWVWWWRLFLQTKPPFPSVPLLLLPQGMMCVWARRALQRFLPWEKVFNSCGQELCPSACAVCVEQAGLTPSLPGRGQGGLAQAPVALSLLRVALNTENVPASATWAPSLEGLCHQMAAECWKGFSCPPKAAFLLQIWCWTLCCVWCKVAAELIPSFLSKCALEGEPERIMAAKHSQNLAPTEVLFVPLKTLNSLYIKPGRWFGDFLFHPVSWSVFFQNLCGFPGVFWQVLVPFIWVVSVAGSSSRAVQELPWLLLLLHCSSERTENQVLSSDIFMMAQVPSSDWERVLNVSK